MFSYMHRQIAYLIMSSFQMLENILALYRHMPNIIYVRDKTIYKYLLKYNI